MENRIEVIKNYLRSFAEEHKAEMSVNVYNGIWDLIQSIDEEEKQEERDFVKNNKELCDTLKIGVKNV